MENSLNVKTPIHRNMTEEVGWGAPRKKLCLASGDPMSELKLADMVTDRILLSNQMT